MTPKQHKEDEYVLALDVRTLWAVGYFEGFSANRSVYNNLMAILQKATFLRRKEAETDPGYKQIIPYVLLAFNNKLFSYRRGQLLGESRLQGNYSLGLGGHISTRDLNLFNVPYVAAMQREVLEEVEIHTGYKDRLVGLINDDSNDVGRVHLGIVHLFDLEGPHVRPREKSINEPNFVSIEELIKQNARYESWSQICIQNIDKIIGTHNQAL